MHTISPLTPLPAITEAVTIDGYSQPGASESSVVLGGTPDARLLIELSGDAVESPGPVPAGLELRGPNSTVKGLVINGDFQDGILIAGASASGNTIRGNYIGTDPTGMESNGVLGFGVDIQGASTNVVGGTTAAERNVISGNGVETGAGVRIIGSTATENAVRGNVIGLSTDGRLEVPNRVGVDVAGAASDNDIGSTFPSNWIAGNTQDGVRISASGNRVQGNFIGFTWVGEASVVQLGNDGHGIRVSASETQISNNTIANSGGDGVFVAAETDRVSIRSTRTRFNAGLGIDLEPDGVTPNDGVGDADIGPNGLQNFPELEDVTFDGSSVTVQGTLRSTPSTTFALDFFASSASASNPDGCDPTGFGEGANAFGSANVTTNVDGFATISATFSAPSVSPGAFITATATDPVGNTSEYSECFATAARGRVLRRHEHERQRCRLAPAGDSRRQRGRRRGNDHVRDPRLGPAHDHRRDRAPRDHREHHDRRNEPERLHRHAPDRAHGRVVVRRACPDGARRRRALALRSTASRTPSRSAAPVTVSSGATSGSTEPAPRAPTRIPVSSSGWARTT